MAHPPPKPGFGGGSNMSDKMLPYPRITNESDEAYYKRLANHELERYAREAAAKYGMSYLPEKPTTAGIPSPFKKKEWERPVDWPAPEEIRGDVAPEPSKPEYSLYDRISRSIMLWLLEMFSK